MVAQQRKLFGPSFMVIHGKIHSLECSVLFLERIIASMSQDLGRQRNALNFIMRGGKRH